jgi:Type I restriction-modification system methyltransferase subunit
MRGWNTELNIVKEYKQYFTPLDLADFMVKLVPEDNVNTVVDLSMGECGLLEAAKKRWNNASFWGADIDETLLSKIHAKSPYIHTFSGDSLGDSIGNWVEYQDILEKNKFDLAIANPPFNYFDQVSVCVDDSEMVLTIEMRFLLKYIEIVKEGGYICIILPYGFLSLDLYSKLRLEILKRATIHKVIKIFENCFERIDADTCLLLLQKKSSGDEYIQDKIAIEYLDNQYSLQNHTNITISSEKNRLDLEYNKLLIDFQKIRHRCPYPIEQLSQYVENCKRGRTLANKKDLVVEKGIRFLHTTDVKYLNISNDSPVYVLRNTSYFKESIVRPRNILIGRVGKACIGKIAIVPEHYPKTVASDCIFCLEIKDIDPYYLTLFLASIYGQMQLKGLAKGSCSKYITKEDLLQLLIIVPDMEIQIYFRQKYLDILSRCGRINKVILLEKLVFEMENILGKE